MADDIRLRINLDGTQAIRALEQLNRSGTFDRLRASVTTLGTALAASFAAAAGGIIVALQGAVDRADQLSKGSLITGLTTQQLSELAVAGELADASIETIITSLGRLNRAAVEASQGSKAQVEAFTALGVPIRDVNGNLRPTRELLDDVADGLANVRDGATRSALAQELFGKSGAELLPLLGNGSASLREAAAEAREFGLTLSTETGQQAEAFNDNITRLGLVARGAANNLAADLLPALVPVTDQIVATAKAALDLNARNDIRKFAEDAAIGLAVLAESLIAVLRTTQAFVGSFAVVFEDIRAVALFPGLLASQAEKAEYEKVLEERRQVLQTANQRYLDLINGDGARISNALRKSFSDQATARAAQNPVNPLASIQNTLNPGGQPQIFRDGRAPADQVGLVSLITRETGRLNVEKSKTTGFDARLKAENAALAEQERRATALANLAQQYDRQQLGRASSLAEGVLTPAEQFRRQVAELNTLVRDGALAQAADRLGVDAGELQNRILIGFGQQLGNTPDSATEDAKASITELTTFAEEAGRNIQDALAGALRNGFDGGLKGALRSLAGFLADAASQLAASGILNALFGNQGGAAGLLGSGGFGAVVGSLFSGLGFANGGNPPVGRASLVGERGPELFIPRVPGTIIPNNRLGDFGQLGASLSSGNGAITINAPIDARGAQDPQGIIRAGAALKADILQSVGKAMQRGYSPGSN